MTTTADILPVGPSLRRRLFAGTAGPVTVVVLAIIVVWYLAAIGLNGQLQRDADARAHVERGTTDFILATWSMQKPKLPAPHQVLAEVYKTTLATPPASNRSLVYHAWVTLSATLAGFVLGTLLGILLAVGIVHSRSLDSGLMPWVIASQMIPILAIAPVIVVAGFNLFTAMGLPTGAARFLPKAIISTYLSFFPIAVGMVKGFRSPERLHLDLMRTYSATQPQTFWKLRWPAALPFLFVSMRIGVAASLVGAIVGELPTGAVAGLGARMLSGSYYGQTIQIWSALFVAALLAAVLVTLVGVAERLVLRRLGMMPA